MPGMALYHMVFYNLFTMWESLYRKNYFKCRV